MANSYPPQPPKGYFVDKYGSVVPSKPISQRMGGPLPALCDPEDPQHCNGNTTACKDAKKFCAHALDLIDNRQDTVVPGRRCVVPFQFGPKPRLLGVSVGVVDAEGYSSVRMMLNSTENTMRDLGFIRMPACRLDLEEFVYPYVYSRAVTDTCPTCNDRLVDGSDNNRNAAIEAYLTCIAEYKSKHHKCFALHPTF
jgi:hypothetical protein